MPARHNQITTGYAAATGMLETEEAARLLDACLPADYPVAWRRKSTPLFCEPTTDLSRLARRVRALQHPAFPRLVFAGGLPLTGAKPPPPDLLPPLLHPHARLRRWHPLGRIRPPLQPSPRLGSLSRSLPPGLRPSNKAGVEAFFQFVSILFYRRQVTALPVGNRSGRRCRRGQRPRPASRPPVGHFLFCGAVKSKRRGSMSSRPKAINSGGLGAAPPSCRFPKRRAALHEWGVVNRI